MKPYIDALITLVSKFNDLTAERGELDAGEEQARQELEAAAGSGPLKDARIAEKIRAANQTLDAINARRSYIAKQLRPIAREMKEALRTADSAWTRIVRASGDRIAAEFYALNAHFYGGNMREAKRELNHEILPAWNANNLALWQANASELNEENALQFVRSFLDKVINHIDRFDLSLGNKK